MGEHERLERNATVPWADDSMRSNHQTEDGDLAEMLGELRILLPTAQLLSAFLIAVPFAPGFNDLVGAEKGVFLATFLLSITSLVLLSAPAVQHRLLRPLTNRASFKTLATRQIVLGASAMALALVLATQLVLSAVLGHLVGNIAAAGIALFAVGVWWMLPQGWRRRGIL
jgi:hypothetical protein